MKENSTQGKTASAPVAVQLENQDGTVYLDLSYKEDYILAKWHGYISADEVVTAAKAYLELMHISPRQKLLNDKSDVTGDWQDANNWIEFEWLPRATKAGLRFMAHVLSSNLFSRLAAHDLYMRFEPPLQVQTFSNTKSAEQWLQQCYLPEPDSTSAH